MRSITGKWLIRVIAALPLSLARALAVFIARWMQWSNSKAYRITRINLQLTQPQLSDKDIDSLASRSLQSTLINSLEMPVIWRRDNTWLEKKILKIESDEEIKTLINTTRGVLVVCPHVGNWEVFGRYLPRYGTTTSLYQPTKI